MSDASGNCSWNTIDLGDIQDVSTTPKKACVAATTANIANVLTGAPNSIDGITPLQYERILVKNQTTASQNGIYVVNTVGTGTNGVWARSTDADSAAECAAMIVPVQKGTTNGGKWFSTNFKSSDTLDTTAMNFTLLNGDSVTTTVLANNTPTVVDTSLTANVKSVKYVIECMYSSQYQISELLLVTDGTDANTFLVEYGINYTGAAALASFTCGVTGGTTLNLTATAANAGGVTLKVIKTTFG